MKATLLSFVSLLVSLCLFALLFRPEPPTNQPLPTNCPAPTPAALPQAVVKNEPADPNEKFRIVPSNFAHVDFSNRSYGLYRTFSKVNISLNLINGDYDYSDGDGGQWFRLKDVYFTDVTGDERPEAIVLLTHVQCGVSCDGGSTLILVYKTHGSVEEIWRFETGSNADGCGLRSLTIMRKQITVEMFGKCPNPQLGYSGPGKFLVGHTTVSNFRLSGGRFVKRETEVFFAPVRDVKNYQPQIHIID
ncbi:MAG TPA: hypothetical protein VF290_03305 [Pyrinomonadaceae bacterium]